MKAPFHLSLAAKYRILLSVALIGCAVIPGVHALDLAASSNDRATAIAGTPPARPVARPGSPNVLIWLMDDVGFAQVSSYGGLVETPNIDRVAGMGLRYSNFRSTPVCSSSRAALLTGRNPHTVHVGGHAMGPRGFPGYDTLIPSEAGTVAENFHQAGYRTFALGKWDHAPVNDVTQAGPYTYWPQGQGFDRFYGFLTADTDNFDPMLWDGNAPVASPHWKNYHLNRDLADKAIEFIGNRSSSHPAPPFLMYWATGTAHAPHHAPADWIARYKGRFDAGWDVARDEIFERQKAQGIVPAEALLPPRPAHMQAWESLSPDEQRLYARQMEVYAASLSYADDQFGRILDELALRGELENTIVVVTSDNGASAEGGPTGLMNESSLANAHMPTVAENLAWLEQWGGPDTYPHYAFGWAVAGNTPFNYYKQTAWEGGIHVPLVVAWPAGIAARGEWRRQFAYIADITPTVLGAAGVAPAGMVHGVKQSPFDGQDLQASFQQSAEPDQRAQYFEMYGNRSIVKGEWKAVASDRTETWDLTTTASIDNPWLLFNLTADPGETRNLAGENPKKIAELDAEFKDQAARYHVDPMDGGGGTRVYLRDMAMADFAARRGQWRYPTPVSRVLESNAPPVKFMSHAVSADITLDSGEETGPIYAMGGSLGGMGLYLKDGRPVFILRGILGEEIKLESTLPLDKGDNNLMLNVEYIGNVGMKVEPLARRTIHIVISANGREMLNESTEFAMPGNFSSSETFDIGRDDGKALTDDYQAQTAFPGTIRNVVFDFQGALKQMMGQRGG